MSRSNGVIKSVKQFSIHLFQWNIKMYLCCLSECAHFNQLNLQSAIMSPTTSSNTCISLSKVNSCKSADLDTLCPEAYFYTIVPFSQSVTNKQCHLLTDLDTWNVFWEESDSVADTVNASLAFAEIDPNHLGNCLVRSSDHRSQSA